MKRVMVERKGEDIMGGLVKPVSWYRGDLNIKTTGNKGKEYKGKKGES